MCGFAGIYHPDAISSNSSIKLDKMLESINHRGPDGAGKFSDMRNIILGTVRLAMIDSHNDINILTNIDESLSLAYNGEIYNHLELRKSLQDFGYQFKTASDGEVIIHLYKEYGYEFLNKLDGMFAFALWDANRHTLFLARDHLGIKPLYYQNYQGGIRFASELKALVGIQDTPLTINSKSLANYFDYRFIPAPNTIYQHVKKLEPGSFLIANPEKTFIKNYWKPTFNAETDPDNFKSVFDDAIQSTIISDHKIGVFLSGGLDSSSIIKSMVESNYLTKSFTIGYENASYEDENNYASMLAGKLNIPHYYLQIKSSDVSSNLREVIWHLDEPMYSTVSISTYQLAKMASRYVKGIMTGDGSDELLLGYNYLLRPLEAINSKSDWKKTYLHQIGWMSEKWRLKLLSDPYPADKLDLLNEDAGLDPLDTIRYFEMRYRLPEYHLCRVDRLTMSHSIEARLPFLRQSVVNLLSGQLSTTLLIAGQQKDILRNAFFDRLPNDILARNKQPFTAPYVQWLKGPLKRDVSNLLLGSQFHHSLGIEMTGLIELLNDCYGSKGEAFSVLWGIFNLFKWYEIFRK